MSDTNTPHPANRPNSGRFQPGRSGNPSGRPRRTDADRKIDELARARSEEAFEVAARLMHDGDNDRTRLTAALAVIERAHGKPGERLAEPVTLPEGATLADQGRAVLAAACRGDITPGQA